MLHVDGPSGDIYSQAEERQIHRQLIRQVIDSLTNF